MKIEFENILQAYRDIDFTKNKSALATIVKVEGSSYRRAGARMLIVDNGNWTGAISGGCLEKDALRKALAVIQNDKAKIVTYDTSEEDENAFGIGLGCNGIIDVLMEPLHEYDETNPLELLAQLLKEKKQAVMATIFGADAATGQRKIFKHDFSCVSTINDSRLESSVDEKMAELSGTTGSRVTQLDKDHSLLVEVLRPDIQLLVFGAGYDAIPLVKIAKLAGCHVTVIYENSNHLNSSLFADADEKIYATTGETLAKVPVNEYSAAVLISHNFNYDKAIVQQLLKTNIQYIGMLGPQKKKFKLVEQIGNVEDKKLQRIYNPIGLDIGAETPEEIALSIISEIKAAFNNGSGQMLRYKKGPVHSR